MSVLNIDGLRSSGCINRAEDAYSSMAPDPTFALSEVRVALHSILYMFFWIMITFDTMLTSPFCILPVATPVYVVTE